MIVPLVAQGAVQDPVNDQQQPPPPTTPPAQPPTTPPDQPPTTPPAQPPVGVEPTPPIPKPEVTLPPPRPAPAITTERDTGGDGWSIEPIYWLTHSAPSIFQGKANTVPIPGDLGFPGKSSYAPGFAVTIPTGHENSLEVTGFQVKSQGNTVLGVSEVFFGNLYAIHDVLATSTTTRTYKVSWNYLTWPYPSAGAKFRLKTLYEIRYTNIEARFNAPADINAGPVIGTKSQIRPSFGLGIEYHPARHVRFEVKGSGFGYPHHGYVYDAEASLVGHFPHFEVLAGGRVFHVTTTPQDPEYFTQTMWGPYGGLRFIWK
jgi:hypothetical protein